MLSSLRHHPPGLIVFKLPLSSHMPLPRRELLVRCFMNMREDCKKLKELMGSMIWSVVPLCLILQLLALILFEIIRDTLCSLKKELAACVAMLLMDAEFSLVTGWKTQNMRDNKFFQEKASISGVSLVIDKNILDGSFTDLFYSKKD